MLSRVIWATAREDVTLLHPTICRCNFRMPIGHFSHFCFSNSVPLFLYPKTRTKEPLNGRGTQGSSGSLLIEQKLSVKNYSAALT
jgi:hypothetical protein